MAPALRGVVFVPKQVTHSHSFRMTDDARQLEMLDGRASEMSVELQDELARGCRDRHHAITKCYEVSNLTGKQVFGPLDIEQATFSRILGGTAFLPPNKLFGWMDLCGNEIPLRYDAHMRGYELTPKRSSVERELEDTKRKLAEERLLNERLVQLVRQR